MLAPAGFPETEKVIVSTGPVTIAVEIGLVATPLAPTEINDGVALIEKSLSTAGDTTRVTWVVCAAATPVPVTESA